MKRELKKNEKVQVVLYTVSVLLIILGILFLVNAMQENPENGFFTAFCAIDNVIAKYIVVILTMACGIMLFSNVSTTLENKKLREGMTIGITTFSTVLTVPLVYVFFAIFPYAVSKAMGPVGKIMGIDRIYDGLYAWFGSTGAFIWVVFAFLLVLSIVFITVPLLTGILACKGKTIKVGKQASGKFGIGIAPLPVLAKQAQASEEEYASNMQTLAAEVAADEAGEEN